MLAKPQTELQLGRTALRSGYRLASLRDDPDGRKENIVMEEVVEPVVALDV